MTVALKAPLRPVPSTDIAKIPNLVRRLRTTFDSGQTRPLHWRRDQLQRLRALVRNHGDELAQALHLDLGKPEFEAWSLDLAQVTAEATLALRKLVAWSRPQRAPGLPGLGRCKIVREPLGVALIIAPWNYPVGLLLSPLVGAIAAGNCAVLKPSESTMHTSTVLAKRIRETMDPTAIAVVEGGVEETTALLEERFDHIFYTGGGHVGRVVMRAAAEHLTPVTLELGGKSPCIVDEHVDMRIAVRRIAWGKFVNAGQTCVAPDYVLVSARREGEFLREIGVAIREFYGGDPSRSPHFARIVNQRHHARLVELLASGEICHGGRNDPETRYLEPTVMRNVAADSPIMQEEIFGPILPVLPVRNLQQAIDFVNDRPKPLALYVFSKDEDVQQTVIESTSSGGVSVNGTVLHIASPTLPFGGVGESGMGAYHGRHTFETFSHRKAVMTRGMRFDPKLLYPPYSERRTRWIRRLL